jgi:hypothetical protein
VDQAAVSALMKQADEAAALLQKEAGAAIGSGEVEDLQMLTAASAALSRDLLTFKETADRLRGLGAAPRLGAGALDPDVVLPGQAPRPAAAKSTAPAPVRAELRDFHALDQKPRSKTVMVVVAFLVFLAALGNALFFALPRHSEVPAEAAGPGVQRVDVSGESALVAVTPEWVEHWEREAPKLIELLRAREVKRAILMLPNGTATGMVDVPAGKVTGVRKPKPKESQPPQQ